jgi:hypothetical protein
LIFHNGIHANSKYKHWYLTFASKKCQLRQFLRSNDPTGQSFEMETFHHSKTI